MRLVSISLESAPEGNGCCIPLMGALDIVQDPTTWIEQLLSKQENELFPSDLEQFPNSQIVYVILFLKKAERRDFV